MQTLAHSHTHTHICKYVLMHILLLSFGVFMANCTALLVVVSALAVVFVIVVGTCVSSCSSKQLQNVFQKIGSIVSKKYIK